MCLILGRSIRRPVYPAMVLSVITPLAASGATYTSDALAFGPVSAAACAFSGLPSLPQSIPFAPGPWGHAPDFSTSVDVFNTPTLSDSLRSLEAEAG